MQIYMSVVRVVVWCAITALALVTAYALGVQAYLATNPTAVLAQDGMISYDEIVLVAFYAAPFIGLAAIFMATAWHSITRHA